MERALNKEVATFGDALRRAEGMQCLSYREQAKTYWRLSRFFLGADIPYRRMRKLLLFRELPVGNDEVSFSYDALGLPSVQDQSGFGLASRSSLRYKGYVYEHESGLYFLGFRLYDPSVGMFLSPDSPSLLDFSRIGGLNLYVHCYNDPVNYLDRSGHFPVLAAILIGLGATALVGGGLIIGGRLSGNKALTNIGDTIISVGETAAGIAMIATGVGGPFGMALLGIGIGSFTNGLITMSNGGSYHAGWAGGQLSGALSFIRYFGGAIGAFAGSALTDLIDYDYDFNQVDLAKAGASAAIAFGLSWFAGFIDWGNHIGLYQLDMATNFTLLYENTLLSISNSVVNVWWRGKKKLA